MQKSLYYASPLRRDYITKPVRNFPPITIEENSRSGTIRDQNQPIQKVTRFVDGLLVNLVFASGAQSGIFLFNNNICLIYSLQGGKPQNISYLISPSGLILSANYQLGILNKRLIAMYDDKFIICQNYKKGVKEGEQYFFNSQEKFLVISVYKKGRFQQIKNVVKGEFHKIMKDNEILERVQQLQSKNFTIDRKFPHLRLSEYQYYGQLNDKCDMPHGYGILLGNKQIYIGNFYNGFLNGIGCIRFEDGNVYFGDFQYGTCSGYGSVSNGKTVAYKYQQQNITKQQFDEYLQHLMVKDKQHKWSSKYDQLCKLFQQINEKNINDLASYQSQAQSQVNVQIKQNQCDQRMSISQQFDDNKQHTKNQQLQSSKPISNKGAMIPKLQLTKEEKQQSRMTMKENQHKLTNRKKQSFIDKNMQPQMKSQQKQKYRRAKNSFLEKSHKVGDKSAKVTFDENEEHLGTQIMKYDKQYVDWQETHLKPNEMQLKQKYNKNTTERLQKQQGDTKINLGKIMRVGSEISEKKQNEFIKHICL